MTREPTGSHKIRAREAFPEDIVIEAVRKALPSRSRWLWPAIVTVLGGGGGWGGSYLHAAQRAQDDDRYRQELADRVDAAEKQVGEIKASREVDHMEFSTKLDAIKDSLGEIKAALKERRGR
jgi:hypothetical protein